MDGESGSGDDGDRRSAMPRWVKGFLIAGVVVIVLIAAMLLSGHGPGRHLHARLTRPPVPSAWSPSLQVARW